MKAPKDYFNLMSVAKVYLFVQLFITPILMSVFAHSALTKTIESELYFPMATTFTLESVSLSVLAYVCFLCGGVIRPPSLTMRMAELDWSSSRFEWLFWGLVLIAYMSRLINLAFGSFRGVGDNIYYSFLGSAAFFTELSWVHLLALALLGVTHYENQLVGSKVAKYYPLVLTYCLIAGGLNGSSFALMFPALIHIAIRQRYHPIKFSNLFLIIILIVCAIYLKTYIKSCVVNQCDELSSFLFAPITFLVNRLSVSFVISAVVNNLSFSYGFGLFEQFLYAFKVPGFEYAVPDGNFFGRNLSLIDENDYRTAMAISVVGDLILHTGIFGLSVGMFILGVLYRFVASFPENNARVFWVMYSMLLPIMLHGLESPVAILIGTIVRIVFLCGVIYLFCSYFMPASKAKRCNSVVKHL